MFRKTQILVSLLLCLSILALPTVHMLSATSTMVAVDPPLSTANVGDTFSVNVNVTNVDNFTCWDLNLYYLNGVLNCVNATEGSFLKSGGSPYGAYFTKNITNNYNSTYGLLSAYSTLLGSSSYAANGSGVIMTVTFMAVGGGSTALVLSDIMLGDGHIPPWHIPYIYSDGAVQIMISVPSGGGGGSRMPYMD